MVTPSAMPSMMMSEPRAPSLVGATPNGSFWPGMLVRERGQHRGRLVLGDLLVGGAGAGQHARGGEHQRGLVGSGDGQVHRDADLLVEVRGLGRAGEHQPAVAGDARLGGAAGGVVGLPRRRLDQQVVDAHEAADVGGVDDDAALHLADRQFGVGPDSQDACVRSIECRVASSDALPATG